MNILKISFIDSVQNGKRIFFWVTLETENETRQCCYELTGRSWNWHDGDNEPRMSLKLEAIFHSKRGNNALSACFNTGISITLTD